MTLLSGCASQSAGKGRPNPFFATVEQVRGAPQWAHGDSAWKPLPLHVKVYQGDQIRTDPKSSADLLLGKYGGTFHVPERSELVFEEFGQSPENLADTRVVVHLKTGHVAGNTLDLPETTQFFIKTQAGMIQLKSSPAKP